jgi:hypothetical protein
MDAEVVTAMFIAVILRYLLPAVTPRRTRQRERERDVKAKSRVRSEG